MEIADGWNWLRIVFIFGLGIEDVEPLYSATRVIVPCRDIDLEIADGWNRLQIVYIVGLDTGEIEPLVSATRI